jgi:DNA polymerase V
LIIVQILRGENMTHGGKRTGAGRPKGTGKYRTPTKAVRLPTALAEHILELLNTPIESGHLQVVEVLRPNRSTKQELPLYESPVAAGFPSPAEEYVEGRLDLNKYLIKHPAATFFVRVSGESMTGAGIHPGDLLIVDRAVEAAHGKVVIAVINGELTVKRLHRVGDSLCLVPENAAYPVLTILESMNFEVWGVVTHTIHAV